MNKRLKSFDHAQDVEIVLHSFELDPDAPLYDGEDLVDKIAHKYGTSHKQAIQSQEGIKAGLKDVGLTFNYEQAKPTNTLDAHRLIHYAADSHKDLQLDDALKTAYLSGGELVSDKDTLVKIATSVGLDPAGASKVLDSDECTSDVLKHEQEAPELGIKGVPFFIFDNKYAVSGAQPVALFEEVLQKTWDETHQETT